MPKHWHLNVLYTDARKRISAIFFNLYKGESFTDEIKLEHLIPISLEVKQVGKLRFFFPVFLGLPNKRQHYEYPIEAWLLGF